MDIRGQKGEHFVDLEYKRSCSKLQIRDLGKKENRTGAEPVPLMLCASFKFNLEEQTTNNKNVKFLPLCKGIRKSEVSLQCICNKNQI